MVGPTHPICSMIYGSTGATHFDQLAKILVGTVGKFRMHNSQTIGLMDFVPLELPVGLAIGFASTTASPAVENTERERKRTLIQYALPSFDLSSLSFVKEFDFLCSLLRGSLPSFDLSYVSFVKEFDFLCSLLRGSSHKYFAELGAQPTLC
ncbi:hypothetical protein Dsin_003818 [Dipteronia sinensis]|uniref:Uncharacterized protein n=1 Tax=Dipteronia sinensis TaxID=43782 RepID=A0AAE0ELA5_9ROSI|nr:hypothetical protein Dsin_003818 [Dipteronia sinensis]